MSAATTLALTADEIILLAAYRKMDDRGQDFILRLADAQSTKWPRHIVPTFRLIASGAA